MTNQPQLSLFPVRDSLKTVEDEAIAMLPITTTNDLIKVLNLQRNTIEELNKTKGIAHDLRD